MAVEQNVPVRSSLQDARGSFVVGYGSDGYQSEKQDGGTEKAVDSGIRNQSMDSDVAPIQGEEVFGSGGNKKGVAFTKSPNTTTWQKQSEYTQKQDLGGELQVDESRAQIDANKLSTVRMKLEEKRRQIEMEKRKLELAISRQQQKVGQAAFLQTINKVNAFD